MAASFELTTPGILPQERFRVPAIDPVFGVAAAYAMTGRGQDRLTPVTP
jgi:hypothetical protein